MKKEILSLDTANFSRVMEHMAVFDAFIFFCVHSL